MKRALIALVLLISAVMTSLSPSTAEARWGYYRGGYAYRPSYSYSYGYRPYAYGYGGGYYNTYRPYYYSQPYYSQPYYSQPYYYNAYRPYYYGGYYQPGVRVYGPGVGVYVR